MIKTTTPATADALTYPFCDLDCEDIHALMLQTMMSKQAESFDRHCSDRKLKLQTYC